MNYNRFWLLAAKRLSGDATKEELCELDLIISGHPEALQLYIEAEKAWSSSPSHLADNVTNENLSQLRRKLAAAKTNYPASIEEDWTTTVASGKKVRYFLIPAILILAVAAFFFIEGSGKNKITAGKEVVKEHKVFAQKGSRRTSITLPDGSTVLLNADSRIYYKNDFASKRELRLEGEAFFDVVKDKRNPFVIHTSEMDIKVLGTTFNVRSYPEESLIEAALIKGSIEVTFKKRGEQPITLKPNEKISITTEKVDVVDRKKQEVRIMPEPVISIKPIQMDENVIREIAWTQNKLYLEGERLDNAVLKLERWFGKTIRIENNNLKGVRYTANFENETLEQVLKALQLSVPFHYRTEKETIIIY